MQTILDRNGKFVATVDGPVNMEDLKKDGKTVVEGDAPLKELQAKMERELDAAAVIAKGERDEEHKHLHDLEERLIKLESLINSTG